MRTGDLWAGEMHVRYNIILLLSCSAGLTDSVRSFPTPFVLPRPIKFEAMNAAQTDPGHLRKSLAHKSLKMALTAASLPSSFKSLKDMTSAIIKPEKDCNQSASKKQATQLRSAFDFATPGLSQNLCGSLQLPAAPGNDFLALAMAYWFWVSSFGPQPIAP